MERVKVRRLIILCIVAGMIVVYYTLNHFTLKDSEYIRFSIRDADKITLYKGLPRAIWSQSHSKSAKTRRIGNYTFFANEVVYPGEKIRILKAILSNSTSINRFSGEKKCGGFNPDYVVICGDYKAFVCFGCQEVIYSHDNNDFRYDLSEQSYTELIKTLTLHDQIRKAK